LSFKDALNQAVRSARAQPVPKSNHRFQQKTFDHSIDPGVHLIKAMQLAGELEDQEIIRKMEMRK